MIETYRLPCFLCKEEIEGRDKIDAMFVLSEHLYYVHQDEKASIFLGQKAKKLAEAENGKTVESKVET